LPTLNIEDHAQAITWRVSNYSASGGEISISGWDFGGEGPIALLHHANGMCAATWAPVAMSLRARYRVFAIDARGHGDSQHLSVPEDYAWSNYVDDLAQVANQIKSSCGVARIALGVGSSFGGIVTAAAQAQNAQLFSRLVILDPPIHPTSASAAAVGIEWVEASTDQRKILVEQTLKRTAVWASRDAARQAWRTKPLFAPWHDQAFDLYLSQGLRDRDDGQVELKCDPTVEAHIFATTGSLDVLDYAPKVRVPVHLVRAQKGFFAVGFFRGVAGLFANAEFSEIAAGHMLPLEAPEMVVEMLLELPCEVEVRAAR